MMNFDLQDSKQNHSPSPQILLQYPLKCLLHIVLRLPIANQAEVNKYTEIILLEE